ncbi:hypothetical protein BB8028_0004g02010 [Beauveria bassiana]|uniref:AAA+ ATPase domain-containing protein n=1 Tax=Beauveria bassiana TaxID=176275 RepID=A0A2S7YAR3_BEABA|nr:hypothetical protein BB8028_0004g02010 [Beauveria bassiana]
MFRVTPTARQGYRMVPSIASSNLSVAQGQLSGFRSAFLRNDAISALVWKWRCKLLRSADNDRDKDLQSQADEEEVGGEPVIKPVIKIMYEGPQANVGYDWVDYPPEQISKATARELDGAAIIIFMVKDYEKRSISGHVPLKYHSFEVKYLAVVSALASIFKKQDYYISKTETALFKAPFHVLFFCQDEIKQLCNGLEARDDELAPYLRDFVKTMNLFLRDILTKLNNLGGSGLISFATVWTLFPRGATVYSTDLESEFLCKVTKADYISDAGETYLQIGVKVLRFNGDCFVWTTQMLRLDSFSGNKPIKQLRHYPFKHHTDMAGVYDRLQRRGNMMLNLQNLQYRCYNKVALYWQDIKTPVKHHVEGRILVDVAGYQKYKDNSLCRGSAKRRSPKRRNEDEDDLDDWGIGAWDEADSDFDAESIKSFSDANPDSSSDRDADANQPENCTFRRHITESQCQRNKEMMLRRKDDLPFVYGLVGGYALKTNLWVQFYIEDIEPIIWNETAYSHLVYDEPQKDLILSFVQRHSFASATRAPMSFASRSPPSDSSSTATEAVLDQAPKRTLAPNEDVIIGKGQGLVILLSGPTGTGKTLMAEAVADRVRRPLVPLPAENLGTQAGELGPHLRCYLTMAAEWNGIVLLDEADVFMAQRDPVSVYRNELVSIFLRELEYCRGVVFLTTNLYETIDSAFRSRVSLHLRFSELSRDARKKVWRNFLSCLAPQTLKPAVREEQEQEQEQEQKQKEGDENKSAVVSITSDASIDELSLWQLNGRDIQTVHTMARMWCDYKKLAMTVELVESVIRATNPSAIKCSKADWQLYS